MRSWSLVSLFGGSFIFLALSACGQRVTPVRLTPEVVARAVQGVGGLEAHESKAAHPTASAGDTAGLIPAFVPNGPFPIAQANAEAGRLGAATVFVARNDGAYGSGFFVSSDGLFLTSEHVVEVSRRCDPQRCAGLRVVRELAPGGAMQVFRDIRLIAASNSGESDFALLKVMDLPQGQTVPYLEVDLRPTVTPTDQLWVLGHPRGMPLNFSRGTGAAPLCSGSESSHCVDGYSFQAMILPGNSGGPVIQASTGKVIGIAASINMARPAVDSMDVHGVMPYFNVNAISLSEVAWRLGVRVGLTNGSMLEVARWSEADGVGVPGNAWDGSYQLDFPRSRESFALAPVTGLADRVTAVRDALVGGWLTHQLFLGIPSLSAPAPDAEAYLQHFFGTALAPEIFHRMVNAPDFNLEKGMDLAMGLMTSWLYAGTAQDRLEIPPAADPADLNQLLQYLVG
ncbi:MAG TPA: trypsin-like peptidase domain-containing protein, partial [Bdellovibrionota bacterium]|nr:trypsin-like peptidase domain-containing protein [Bdellovibrionota bacterium]